MLLQPVYGSFKCATVNMLVKASGHKLLQHLHWTYVASYDENLS